jgi:hypothetical protein
MSKRAWTQDRPSPGNQHPIKTWTLQTSPTFGKRLKPGHFHPKSTSEAAKQAMKTWTFRPAGNPRHTFRLPAEAIKSRTLAWIAWKPALSGVCVTYPQGPSRSWTANDQAADTSDQKLDACD